MNRETSRGVASVLLTCEAFGISRQAFYAARHREALTEVPDRPVEVGSDADSCDSMSVPEPVLGTQRPGTWATTEQLRAAIHEIVEDNSAWGVRKVWATLRRRGLRAGHKRVWAIMKADGLTMEPVAERESPGRYGHVSVPESNRRWATDLTTAWTRRDGVVAITPVIDCGDRVALACAVSKSQEASALLAPLEQSLTERFGDPEHVPEGIELRSDHGPQYTGGDCRDLCDRWDIDHTFAPVGRPTGNAVAERFIQTLKIELVWTRDWDSLDELQDAINRWLVRYNGCRPHQSLGWMTPDEKRASNLGLQLEAAA
jgi:transposase InsO family protein